MTLINEPMAHYTPQFDHERHVVLLGDSIFDNRPYVNAGEAVIEQLYQCFAYAAQQTPTARQTHLHLLAKDGDVTDSVHLQLDQLAQKNYRAQHAFLVCGGNDLLTLRAFGFLQQPTKNITEALSHMAAKCEQFRSHYIDVIERAMKLCDTLTVCTIYDQVSGLDEAERLAIATFNEVILKEAMSRNLQVLDLRLLCQEEQDFAPCSPVEPSKYGANKIAHAIFNLCLQ